MHNSNPVLYAYTVPGPDPVLVAIAPHGCGRFAMNDRLRFIQHHEKPILLIDFSHCAKPEMLALLDQVKETVTQQPQNSVLALADFTGAEVDKQVGMRIKEVLVFDRPYVKRSAWVGTESLPKVFYENFKTFSRRDFPTFPNREEAMAWLVGE